MNHNTRTQLRVVAVFTALACLLAPFVVAVTQ